MQSSLKMPAELPVSRPQKQKSKKTSIFPEDRGFTRRLDAYSHLLPPKPIKKASSKHLNNGTSPNLLPYKGKKLAFDTFQTSSCGSDYEALKHKYFELEEESFNIGEELHEIDDEIKALECKKLALLDQLLVLEGLVDPKESPNQ
ncbi:hypothetical protein Droror1_Dr00010988 [Drosera rotundifolia]